MTRLRIRRRDPLVGIALGSDELVAVIPGERAPRRWPLAPPGPGEAISPDLGGALGALRAGLRTGSVRHTLAVALLPALAEMRMVELPGVDADDAARVLSRAASRYFPVADGMPFDIAVEGTGARHRSPFIAIATRRGVLDAIALAARANGFAVARLTSAYSAWAAAASDGGVEDGKSVALRLADRVELVQLRAGRVAAVRRLPVAAEASVARA
ncbi:MAG TPA: hypothetical protein VHM30_06390, partial [Gemmatimonadaceae bacterium]|nr:hypothetical protein [Gemmatimonadaceae bacterium]